MRILLITLCFNLIFVPLVGQQNQPKARETDRKAAEKQGNPPQPSVPLEVHVSGPVKVEATQPKQQAAKEEPKPFLTHGEWVMGILTLIYVGITFFGLRAINRQAGIAQEAAEAASKNALALMNSERAWVVVNVRRVGHGMSSNSAAEIVLTNLGKTVALIKELVVKTETVNSIQDVKGSATEGQALDDVKDVVVAPSEPFEVRIRVPETGTTQQVAVRGIVKYCDSNNRSWYTRFLYLGDVVGVEDILMFRRIPHGYYNSYGEDYEKCELSNPDSMYQ